MRWRDNATNQKFCKGEYFCGRGLTRQLGVLPVGQRKGLQVRRWISRRRNPPRLPMRRQKRWIRSANPPYELHPAQDSAFGRTKSSSMARQSKLTTNHLMRLFDRHMTPADGVATLSRRSCVRYTQHFTACPQHIHRATMPDSRARAGHLLRTNPQIRHVSRRPDRIRCGRPRSGSRGCAAGMP